MHDSDWVIVAPGTAAERSVSINGRLFVGRECAGVEADRRLLIDHPTVSRDHLELRSSEEYGTRLVDLSTHGTLHNGRRVERGEPVALSDGDRIEIGEVVLVFRAATRNLTPPQVRTTMWTVGISRVAVAVGDIIGYTTLTERYGAEPLARATEALFGALSHSLAEHGGTVADYAGDAIFAAWNVDRAPDAVAQAIAFALRADALVARNANLFSGQGLGEQPVRMGWAVTAGEAAAGRPKLGRDSWHGDVINLAFRLSGFAGRDGRAPVLVTDEAASAAPGAARYGEIEEFPVKGRVAPARVRPAHPSDD